MKWRSIWMRDVRYSHVSFNRVGLDTLAYCSGTSRVGLVLDWRDADSEWDMVDTIRREGCKSVEMDTLVTGDAIGRDAHIRLRGMQITRIGISSQRVQWQVRVVYWLCRSSIIWTTLGAFPAMSRARLSCCCCGVQCDRAEFKSCAGLQDKCWNKGCQFFLGTIDRCSTKVRYGGSELPLS